MRIDRLEGASNWLTWKFQMRQYLEAAELFEHVDGTIAAPAADAVAANILAWRRSDAKARRAISAACHKQPLLQIMNGETAKDMWTLLKSTYEQASRSNIVFLQQKYYAFKKEPTDDISIFMSKLMEVVQQLKDQGEAISDSMVITKVLMALPQEYNHFHSAWESTRSEDQTMANLRARLLAEELRMKSQGQIESAEALVAKRNFSKKANPKKSKNHSSSNQSKKTTGGNDGGSSDMKSKKPCFACGERGHWRDACPTRKKKMEAKQGNASTDAFVCHASIPTCDKDAWVLDSGASDHMCHRREWFEDFIQVSTGVTIGNGAKIMARGKGGINVLAFNGKEWISKRMLNVLYVPEIHLNLFSSGKAMDHGHQLKSNSERCELLKDDNIVAVGVRREGLFQMLLRVIEPSRDGEAMANVAIKKISLRAWHERLGHQNIAHVKKFLSNEGIDFINEDFSCEACVYGKQHRGSFENRVEKSTTCGEIIHADVCGPMEESSIGGARYFLLLKDDYSHFRFVYFLKQKSEVANNVKKFVTLAQKDHGHNIRIFRSDNGTEFVNDEMKTFFEEIGIHHQRTVPYTPEQNGCAEREMRTIVESARTMIHSKEMEKRFWAEAVNTAVYVLNRSGTSTVVDGTPYELWYGKRAKIEHLHIFGSEVFVHVPKEKRLKFDPKAVKCIFVGYDGSSKGYRVWNPESRRIEVARDVIFLLEESKVVLSIDGLNGKMENAHVNEPDDADNEDPQEDDEAEEPQTPQMRRGRGTLCDVNERNIVRNRLRDRGALMRRRLTYDDASAYHVAMLAINEEPKTYEQAMKSDESKQWEQAMDDEFASLVKNQTWILVNPPDDQKVIDNRWVYKIKFRTDGSIERFKARLVVRGFTQEYGIDYRETFSPVVKFTSIRAILALAASKRMTLRQFDVKTAFLNGDLEEDVFMKQPIGYDDGSGRVCKLIKSLYGLKQASRCWNRKFTSFIRKFDFKTSESDPCVFVRNGKNGTMILAIYVDDGIIASEDEEAIFPVIDHLRKEFEIKVFEVECFLGLEINRESDGSIIVNQRAYAQKILQRFGMMDCHAVSTPLDTSQNLSDFEADEEVNFPYREAVGSLMYLAVATRPDITFAVGNVSRYLEKPAEAHVNAVKRILKYVKGTLTMGIRFDGGNDLTFCGYSDADYAGDKQTARSTSGYVFMFGGGIISWGSERQRSVALSTTESEYMAASYAIKELMWLKKLLSELLQIEMDAPNFFMDCQSAIRLVKNPEFHKRTKHINVRYHFIREKFEDGEFELSYVPTDEQRADIMTKALPKAKHQFLRALLGIVLEKN